MAEYFKRYKQGTIPVRKVNRLWPLYGAGLENLGQDGEMIEVPTPAPAPDELLIRHDAVGLCFSDIKVIRFGQDHPRIFRDMKKDPVVLGHEVALTVIAVGDDLKDQYKIGDRFILQADIYVNGANFAYGYEIQGGLSEYNIIDQRILNGDDGNYLIPIKPDTGYAESALVEPWACVIAAYYLNYRTALKSSGTAWFIGPEGNREFSLSSGFNGKSHPERILLTHMDGSFGNWLRDKANELGIKVVERDLPEAGDPIDSELVDDIILLDPAPELIEKMSPFLAYHGIMIIAAEKPLSRNIEIDVGRIHYNRWLFIGGDDKDIATIYTRNPVQSSLKKGGRALFVGAGGPMGRMHVQHAIEAKEKPSTIVCADVSDERLADLCESFGDDARENGIEWICVNPTKQEEYQQSMSRFKESGFDDIIVLAPIASVISENAKWLANNGVINIFAGVTRGTKASVNLNEAITRNVRIIGHSASSIENMITMLNEVESGGLETNRSVAAIGSLEAVPDGLRALQNAQFPGKVVIFPYIKPLPLTAVSDLKDVLPTVYAELKNGRVWTKDAERKLVEVMGIIEKDAA